MLLWKHTGSSRMLLASTTHDFRVQPLQSELMVLFVAPLLHYKGSCQSTINILNTVWREKTTYFGAFRRAWGSKTPMPQQHEAKWFSQDSSVVLQASTFGLHVIHAHAWESQAQLQRQRHQLRFEFCHASIGRCVRGVWWKCSEKSGYTSTYIGGMFVLVFPLIAYDIKWMFQAIFNILSWI